ncbi:MAG: hypothetical protein LBJ72_05380 [Dysgonamonadaceae bacterium]|jgi:hypothetical protein|nr:hypothetical protein [Dysgonamonadaceae bacterium]
MDKLSDFVPLLIIIGSVIVSIVQSSNKKKADQDMKKTSLPQGIPMEKPMNKPVVNLPKMKSSAVLPTPEKTKPAFSSFNPEVKRSVSSVPAKNLLDSEIADEPGFVFDTTNADELKRAVIYSEIFNRKEY